VKKVVRTIRSMQQRGDVEHLGCFQCLEGSIMTKFCSHLEGCVLAKRLNFGESSIGTTQSKVDFGFATHHLL
jgi:hypothetical protein